MGPTGLTAVFGMGTGVAPPVWSPGRRPAGGEAGPGVDDRGSVSVTPHPGFPGAGSGKRARLGFEAGRGKVGGWQSLRASPRHATPPGIAREVVTAFRRGKQSW